MSSPLPILVVQARAEEADRLRSLLETAQDARFELEVAPDLAGALEAVHERPPAAVLLDLFLPDSAGIETFARLRAVAPDIPVLVVSTGDDPELALRSVEAGAQEVLVSGALNGPLLSRAVRHAIERQRMATSLRRVSRELYASRAQLLRIIETSQDGILVVDRNTVVRFVNPAAEALFGRSRSELIGETFGLPLGDRARTELALLPRGEDKRIVEAWTTQMTWDDHPAWLISLHDVTEGKRAEEALRHRVVQQAAVARLGQEAAAAIDLEPIIEAAVDTVARTLETPFVQLLELAEDGDRFVVRAGSAHSPDLGSSREIPLEESGQAALALAAGDAVVVADARNEPRLAEASFWRENELRSGVSALVHIDRRVWGVLGAHSNQPRSFSEDDVHFLQSVANILGSSLSRALARRALEAEEAKFRMVAESLAAGLIILDFDGTVDYVNPKVEEMLGFDAAEMIGRPIGEWTVSKEESYDLQSHLDRRREGRSETYELRLRTREGGAILVEIHGAPLRDETGQVVGAIGSFVDISRRRALEEQLLQAQKMEAIGRLAGGVAHDFNNLLTAIQGFSQLLALKLGEGDPRRSDLDEIIRATERATALTGQLLTFSRRQVFKTDVVDLGQVVDSIAALLRRMIGEDIRLETHAPKAPSLVRADRGQLEQMIINLAVNARDAMPDGGTLSVVVEHAPRGDSGAERGVRLVVRDTGVGMSRETLERAFEPFFTTKEAGKGTGLGLATVHGVVEQAGGTVRVESAPGRGTTFEIDLPGVAEVAPTGSGAEALVARRNPLSSPQPAPRSVSSRKQTILVAEDDEAIRRLIGSVLTGRGYSVLSAASATAALDLSRTSAEPIDLLVTDIVMPDIRGPELARTLRAERPGLRILYVSGYFDAAESPQDDLGPDSRLLAKPFGPSALLREVAALVEEPPAAGTTNERSRG